MSRQPPSDERVVIPVEDFDAVIFDMDGVVTDTAGLHHTAWKQLFDDYLATQPSATPVVEFSEGDYRAFVDGRARRDGVEVFLGSRGIHLPEGDLGDPPGSVTIWGLANRKNELFLAMLAARGVRVFESTVALARLARSLGLRTAVVTASQHASVVLAAGGIAELFDACVDGTEIARLALPGKPHPAPFLEAAHRIGVEPVRAVVARAPAKAS